MRQPRPCAHCNRAPEVHRAAQSLARCTYALCPVQPVVHSRDEIEDVVEVWDRRHGGER